MQTHMQINMCVLVTFHTLDAREQEMEKVEDEEDEEMINERRVCRCQMLIHMLKYDS